MFPLCRKCVELNQHVKCRLTDDERALTGVWCTTELNMAVKKVIELFKCTRFITSQTIFTEYVNMWLKIKQESSGYPKNCITEAQKQKYIEDYKRNEGIDLNPDKICFNPGLRALAKLFLKSFWGRFGTKSNLPQTKMITDPHIFQGLFATRRK